MHKNSLEAFKEGTKHAFKKRAQRIFECFFYGHQELTDREILRRLKPGSDDLNYCRPRISELLKYQLDGTEPVLEECGEKVEGGRPVRICRVKMPIAEQVQGSLF